MLPLGNLIGRVVTVRFAKDCKFSYLQCAEPRAKVEASDFFGNLLLPGSMRAQLYAEWLVQTDWARFPQNCGFAACMSNMEACMSFAKSVSALLLGRPELPEAMIGSRQPAFDNTREFEVWHSFSLGRPPL